MADRGAPEFQSQERLHDRLQAAVGDRTYRRIGDLTSTHPETVRRYLTGHAPSVDFISRLASSLGLNINWILTGHGPMRQADVKPHVLREANVADLLTHVALGIERLESRIERLERYTQVLELMIRQGTGHETDGPPYESGSTVEPKSPAGAEGFGNEHGKPAPTQTAREDSQARARSVADALSERSRPDAR